MEESKLIVIEGLDGSGKATQTKLLEERLRKEGHIAYRLSFPNYESPSSALVRMYLNGEFGKEPESVNPYTASAFYAVDRAASFLLARLNEKSNCGSDSILSEKLLIADRYTTSNAIYQLSKLSDDKKEEFLYWLADFEYNKLGIPRPDAVVYLDMEPQISQKLMSKRYSGDETLKDIHESNIEFLQECRRSALYAAKKLGWQIIACSDKKNVRSIEEIAEEIYKTIEGKINLC